MRMILDSTRLARGIALKKILLHRNFAIVATPRATPVDCLLQKTSKTTYASLLSRPSKRHSFHLKTASSLLSQSAGALRYISVNSATPVSWRQKLDSYQELHERYLKEVSDFYIAKKKHVNAFGEIEGEEAYPPQGQSELELEFEEMSWDIFRGLGLVGEKGGERNMLLPRITTNEIFHAVRYVTAPGRGTPRLFPLASPLGAVAEVLERTFGPLDTVQKMVIVPLSLNPSTTGHGAAVAAAATYRVITAYLFYTSATPNDILGVLSQSSILSRQNGNSIIGRSGNGELPALAEFFSFLRLFIVLCEHDDDLREVKDGAVAGESLSRQSRRVLMGRLDAWLSTLDRTKNLSVSGASTSTFDISVKMLAGSSIPSRNVVLTEEQARIVGLDVKAGDLMKIKAFAGTGKTRVLTEYARVRPGKKILYITFNVNAQIDAESKFPRKVVCQTFNALALEAVRATHPKLNFDKVTNEFGPKEISYILRLDNEMIRNALENPLNHSAPGTHKHIPGILPFPTKIKVSRVVYESLQSYMSSTDAKIGYRSLHWIGADSLGLKKDVVLNWVQNIWKGIIEGTGPYLPHDAYVKIMHLQGDIGRDVRDEIPERSAADTIAFGKFDIIMFDEAQDANPVMAEIILRQLSFAGVVVVGDPYQMIYGFKGANNMCFDDTRYRPTYNLPLTHSFRYGNNIAHLPNQLLKIQSESARITAVRDVDVIRRNFPADIESSGSNWKIVMLGPGSAEGGGSGKFTRVFRTNLELLKYWLSYCYKNKAHKVHVDLKVTEYLRGNRVFALLRSGHGLYHGEPAQVGPLKGIPKWTSLFWINRPVVRLGYESERLKSLFNLAMSENGIGIEVKEVLKKAILEDPVSWRLKNRLDGILNNDPPPKLKEFLQAVLSKGRKEFTSPELSLVSNLKDEFENPHFLENLSICEKQLAHLGNRDTADLTLATTHQAKGLEWDRVEVADDFTIAYANRYDLGLVRDWQEGCNLIYVATTRARKELIVGPHAASWLAAAHGSYRFFLSRSQGDCPVCQAQRQEVHSSGIEGISHGQTHGGLIGYESILPTGSFGIMMDTTKESNGWPFGDMKAVIGCSNCILGLSHPAPDEARYELEKFTAALDIGHSEPPSFEDDCIPNGLVNARKGLSEVFERCMDDESKRVEEWEKGHLMWSLGIIRKGESDGKNRKKKRRL